MIYRGACHCRAIGFDYRTGLAPQEWSIRACQCGFCRAHGALSTSDPRGGLSFRADEPARLVRYRFGLRTADFLICAGCGVYVGAELALAEGRFGIININALERGVPVPAAQPVHYDAEDEAGRRTRRMRRWTPVVGGL